MSAVHIVAASLGGAAQFVGALLVLREAARLRRSELGQIGAFGRLWDGVKQTIRNPAPVEIGPMSARAVSSSSATATITVRGPESPEEELRRRVQELEDGLRRTQELVTSEARSLRERIDSVTTYYEKQTGELREKRRSDIARAITRERVGTRVFLAGVIFSLVANLIM
jgi:hypothetical protein